MDSSGFRSFLGLVQFAFGSDRVFICIYFSVLYSFNTEDYIEDQGSKNSKRLTLDLKASTDLDRIIVEGRAFHFLMVHRKKKINGSWSYMGELCNLKRVCNGVACLVV